MKYRKQDYCNVIRFAFFSSFFSSLVIIIVWLLLYITRKKKRKNNDSNTLKLQVKLVCRSIRVRYTLYIIPDN